MKDFKESLLNKLALLRKGPTGLSKKLDSYADGEVGGVNAYKAEAALATIMVRLHNIRELLQRCSAEDAASESAE
jgi:hypothetical protein